MTTRKAQVAGCWFIAVALSTSCRADTFHQPTAIATISSTPTNVSNAAKQSDHWFYFAFLLGSPQVRRELGLSHETSVRVLDLLNYATYLNRGGLMTRKESAEQKAEVRKHSPEVLQSRAVELLSPAQQRRLAQINYQRSGPFVLTSFAEVAPQIGVSTEQLKRLQEAATQAYASSLQSRKVRQQSQNALSYAQQQLREQQQIKQSQDEFLHQCRAAITEILTPVQQARLKLLLGAPFDAEHLTYDVQSYSMN